MFIFNLFLLFQFHFVINQAIGGNFFPDTPNENGKPWTLNSPTGAADFWNARDKWMPTWNTNEDDDEASTLVVDYIKVHAIDH